METIFDRRFFCRFFWLELGKSLKRVWLRGVTTDSFPPLLGLRDIRLFSLQFVNWLTPTDFGRGGYGLFSVYK